MGIFMDDQDMLADLGGTAETLKNPCCRQVRIAQVSIAG